MRKIRKYQKVIYGLILAAVIIWCAAIFAAPLWAEHSDVRGDISSFIYMVNSKNCHQMPERSFMLNGYIYAVCSRCTFIYLAFLLGTISYPFIRGINNPELPSIWFLVIASGIVVLDVGLDMLEIVKNTEITREISGSIIGFFLPFYIIPGVIRIFGEFFDASVLNENKRKI